MVGCDGEGLVFLLSLPRSGSTLLSLILASHDAVDCPPEPWLLLKVRGVFEAQALETIYGDALATQAVTAFLPEAARLDAARQFAITAYNHHLERAGRVVFVDKTPRYCLALDFLETLFPRAKKIWLQRNPLDVAASYKTVWSIEIDELVGRQLGHASFDFSLGLDALDEFFQRPSACKHLVRYEDLVVEPDREVEKLCQFLGLAFQPGMLRFAGNEALLRAHAESPVGDKKVLETQGVHAGATQRWRQDLSGREAAAVLQRVGVERMRRWCYLPEGWDRLARGDESEASTPLPTGDELWRRWEEQRREPLEYVTRQLRECSGDRAARLEQVHALHDRLVEAEADRGRRLEMVGQLDARCRATEMDAAARLHAVGELERRLHESETDRARRLEQVDVLTASLRASEADRVDRLDAQRQLEARLRESEADRAKRLDLLHELEARLRESEADRAKRLDLLHELEARLRESEADRAKRLEMLHELEARLRESDADRAKRLEMLHELEARLREVDQDCARVVSQLKQMQEAMAATSGQLHAQRAENDALSARLEAARRASESLLSNRVYRGMVRLFGIEGFEKALANLRQA